MTHLPHSRSRARRRLLAPCALAVLAAFLLMVGLPVPALAQGDAAADAASAKQKKGKKGKKRKRGKKGKKRGKAKARAAEAAPEAAPEAEGEEEVQEAASDTPTTAAPSGSLRRSNKMEFDARLIRGETAGTGAVVLFDRGQRELPALTDERTGFLDATIREVYGDTHAKRIGDGKRERASKAPRKSSKGVGKAAAKSKATSGQAAPVPAEQEAPATDEAAAPPAGKD